MVSIWFRSTARIFFGGKWSQHVVEFTRGLIKMCGPQHVDKNGIDNILTDAIVLVFVICPSVVVALFMGEVFACCKHEA